VGRGLADSDEVLSDEGGTADEATIDFRLGEEVAGVTGLEASSVLNANAGGAFGTVEATEKGANLLVGVLSVLGGGGFAGADGPNGLVGDGEAFDPVAGDIGEAGLELASADDVLMAGDTFIERLADAEDGFEACLEDSAEFGVDEFIALAEDVSAFGVTAEDDLDAAVLEHGHGDFAGEGAVLLEVGVLSAEFDGGATVAEDGADEEEVGEGWKDGDIDTIDMEQSIHHGAGEVGRGGAIGVHFPVAADELFAIRHGLSIAGGISRLAREECGALLEPAHEVIDEGLPLIELLGFVPKVSEFRFLEDGFDAICGGSGLTLDPIGDIFGEAGAGLASHRGNDFGGGEGEAAEAGLEVFAFFVAYALKGLVDHFLSDIEEVRRPVHCVVIVKVAQTPCAHIKLLNVGSVASTTRFFGSEPDFRGVFVDISSV
jgi:hypothetical protein